MSKLEQLIEELSGGRSLPECNSLAEGMVGPQTAKTAIADLAWAARKAGTDLDKLNQPFSDEAIMAMSALSVAYLLVSDAKSILFFAARGNDKMAKDAAAQLEHKAKNALSMIKKYL